MAKWVKSINDLDFPGNENEESWLMRGLVAAEILQVAERRKARGCKLRLYQNTGVEVEGGYQIADFVVVCTTANHVWAIEIGTLGTVRKEKLEDSMAIDELIHIKRGSDFRWQRTCGSRCPFTPKKK